MKYQYRNLIAKLEMKEWECFASGSTYSYESADSNYFLDIYENGKGWWVKTAMRPYFSIFLSKPRAITNPQDIVVALIGIDYPPAIAYHRQRMLALLAD